MTSFLELGLVNADRSVMRMLPPEIAFRYHALPVATDGNFITVAMTDPEDQHASKVIQEIIDRPICFIHADPGLIDSQLQHLWPASAPHPRILTWFPKQAGHLEPFIEYLVELLDANLDRIDLPTDQPDSIKKLGVVINKSRPDLLLFQAHHPARVMRRILKETIDNNVSVLSSFLAVPPLPHWPIQKLLFILPDAKTRSDLAVGWTEKLAEPGKSQVTVLPVLPPVPLFLKSFLHHNLNGILTGNDQLGMKLRQIANRFKGKSIQGFYKLREGDPVTQIRNEVFTSQPDLIIMPSCLHPGCNTWLYEDLPGLLLKSISTPLLLTSEI